MSNEIEKHVDSIISRLVKWFFIVVLARGFIHILAVVYLYLFLSSRAS